LGCDGVVGDLVEAECLGDGGSRGTDGWWHSQEVAAVSAAVFGGCVDDLDELDRLPVESDAGRPELSVVVLRDEGGVCRFQEPLPADPVERDATDLLVVEGGDGLGCEVVPAFGEPSGDRDPVPLPASAAVGPDDSWLVVGVESIATEAHSRPFDEKRSHLVAASQ
jgi:hypothetical protein